MAQERAFAILTLAFLDGKLDSLFDEAVRDHFIKMLGVEKNEFKYMLESIVKATLLTSVNWKSLNLHYN